MRPAPALWMCACSGHAADFELLFRRIYDNFTRRWAIREHGWGLDTPSTSISFIPLSQSKSNLYFSLGWERINRGKREEWEGVNEEPPLSLASGSSFKQMALFWFGLSIFFVSPLKETCRALSRKGAVQPPVPTQVGRKARGFENSLLLFLSSLFFCSSKKSQFENSPLLLPLERKTEKTFLTFFAEKRG